MTMTLSCQENLLPGDDIATKWDWAQKLGFEAIELSGTGNFGLAARLLELRAARKAGAQFSSVCVAMSNFVGNADAEGRRDAVDNLLSQLTVIAELGGGGVITPASYGKFTNRLPGHAPARTEAESQTILIEAFGTLGEHAKAEGVEIWIEPLNRYEDCMINTLQQGVEMCDLVGIEAVRVMADLYHMNIEEADSPSAIRAAGAYIGHVHISDSNRLEPGKGHVDFAAACRALDDVGYDGVLAVECRLSGPADSALAQAVQHMRPLVK